jgi:hypothetical protein
VLERIESDGPIGAAHEDLLKSRSRGSNDERLTALWRGVVVLDSAAPRHQDWRNRCAEEELLVEEAAQPFDLAA